ncbi:MAG: hypothetical protein GY856_13365, partial [bacterium]|nr:hypothetical protein [bacterium]
NRLKLIYAFKALEPLAERPPDAAYRTLHLTAEILAALGHYAARRPVSLTAFRLAAALTVIDLRNPYGSPLEEAEIFLTPQVLHLEGEALMPMRRAMRAGKSEEILRCAAGMVLELWEFADQLRQSPEPSAGALLHANGWASPATAKILRKLTLGAAVTAVVPDGGLMRAFRPPAAHSRRRRPARRAATRGRGE